MEAFDGLLREALVLVGVLCIPVLLITTVAGTIVAILAAATQVQEQTLSLLPKLLAVGFSIAAFGTFGMRLCAGFFTDTVHRLPAIVHAL